MTSRGGPEHISKDALRINEALHSYEFPPQLRYPGVLPSASATHDARPYYRELEGAVFPNTIRAYQIAKQEGEQASRFEQALRHYGYTGDTLTVDSYLLDQPSAVNMPVDFDSGSVLHIASMRGQTEMAQLLVHRGADVNCVNHARQTSLHAACENNRGAVVMELLVAGADADQRDAMKQTPLHRAAYTGSVDALIALLDYGANTRLRDEGGLAPIHKAATMGRSMAADLLLERDPASANATAASDWTPLHLAAHNGHALTCETLLLHGAEVDAPNVEKRRPLHEAAAVGAEEACRILLRGGANLLVTDNLKSTPLHLACEEGHASAVRTLLEAGAPVTPLDGLRRTPLHVAAEGGHGAVCEALLQFGADPLQQDPTCGVPSPLSVARRNRQADLVALLESFAEAYAQAAQAQVQG
eukprot:gnl/TRDRNA2_/TRDRNA2_42723_c0_seq1.p1 gnl/TRDRNA2_/TRDRNA2_42723_c0~~gnl/TRDRNA2_/TRDRNA2_42723_c0_seq1.p1  ORF type:complete len:416 (+),score=65.47 gnl/TRDRNA2_/TRDRNA2_42723_c0_seq1:73-1320(+)